MRLLFGGKVAGMKRFFLFVSWGVMGWAFFSPFAAAGATLPPACQKAFRRALDADAAWRMSRMLPGATHPLVSTGLVSCARFRGIIWDVRAPFASTITMTTNALVFADEEGMRIKDFVDWPYYAEIRDRTDAFAAGDISAFDGLFDWQSRSIGTNGWVLTLTPAFSQIRSLFTKLVVSGAAEITNVTWHTARQGTILLEFAELGQGTHRLWERTSK